MDTFANLRNYVYNKGIVIFLVGLLISMLIIYIYVASRKRTFNCEVLNKSKISSTMVPINSNTSVYNTLLKKCHIKTAYNCCCTGDFRNDYVDYCALLNCSKQGFRALDFQIFSMDSFPVVSESTSVSKNYKEMYNELPFQEVMTYVKRYFLQDSQSCPNINDPLFLIFRIHSNNIEILASMYDTLNSLFGSASSSNKIYIPSDSTDINSVPIKELLGKVIIVVDITGLTTFESSNLFKITGLKLGTLRNKIYRENEIMNEVISDNTYADKFDNDVCVLYPTGNTSSSYNYDFVTSGIKNGIQFIGLNAQTNDTYLTSYNTEYFNVNSIISKSTVS
jgi:hypothetical protein